jgi:hypothetical protein
VTVADLLQRLGRDAEAADAYRAALALSGNAAEQEFLTARADALDGWPGRASRVATAGATPARANSA